MDIYGYAQEIRLDERQLSEGLGVSRTPIREAMTVLEQRLLRTRRRYGIPILTIVLNNSTMAIETHAMALSHERYRARRLARIHHQPGAGLLAPPRRR